VESHGYARLKSRRFRTLTVSTGDRPFAISRIAREKSALSSASTIGVPLLTARGTLPSLVKS